MGVGWRGDSENEACVQSAIRARWRTLSKSERKERCAAARQERGTAYELSAKASEENRLLYRFALTLVAPRRPRFERDRSSRGPAVARLLGLCSDAPVWLWAIGHRARIDDLESDATWLTGAQSPTPNLAVPAAADGFP